jgi:glycosyltransferase involved in cell wall biosynthesis
MDQPILDTIAIEKLLRKAQQFPGLAHTYAAELDRLLRAAGEKSVTFSANSWANESMTTVKRLGLQAKLAGEVELNNDKVIFNSESLIKQGKRGDAFAYAFSNAAGQQVNALNLFYANHASQSTSTRLYYLNKYLGAYGHGITLKEDASADFFHRITSTALHAKVDGPLVTVIMPAHNAEANIELALGSLLNQTWQNLQIIVIDDASTDGTLQKAKELAKRNARIEVLSSPVNVGPYVCRNLGILHTRGQWLTVHDADDWAFPDRIEQQVNALNESRAVACLGRMMRINKQGQIVRPSDNPSALEDGYLRLCFVSLMVQTAFFRNVLGAWDSVRVGGDAELIERINALGKRTKHLHRPLILCLDHEASLTNHPEMGLVDKTGQKLPLRTHYKLAFSDWHKAKGSKKLSLFLKTRPFEVPKTFQVEKVHINKVFATWMKNLELIKASDIFDEVWYKKQYSEVEKTGLEPAAHYLVYGATGATDPGPSFNSRFYLLTRPIQSNPLVHMLKGKDTGANPKRVLLAAAEVAKTGDHQKAIELAEIHLPQNLAYSAEILRANFAIAKGDEAGWQKHVNAYLAQFGVAPIRLLQGTGAVFDRLACDPLPAVTGGPLISVIMPAWNAEKTVRKAVQSILDQTWRNLELLIVDDASTDGTWTVLQEIAHADTRVQIFRNKLNVGPYVSKNIALTQSKGEWITGHDADDWAHPERLALQFEFCRTKRIKACMSGIIRLTSEGKFTRFNSIGGFVHDAVCRSGLISLMIHRQYMLDKLGGWDLVRTSGDSELLRRIEAIENAKVPELKRLTILCLDNPDGLTNHPTLGFNEYRGISPIRAAYKKSFQLWHSGLDPSSARIGLLNNNRQFDAPKEICSSKEDIKTVLENYTSNGIHFRKTIRAKIVLITDLCMPGGNASSSLAELSKFKEMGLSYAVVHCPNDKSIGKPTSDRYQPYREYCTNWSEVEAIEAHYLICRHPRVLVSKCFAQLLPMLTAEQSFIVKNNSSRRFDGSSVYEISDFIKAGLRIPSKSVEFCPISIGMRDELVNYAKASGERFNLSQMNWNPTFDFEKYASAPKPLMKRPFRIGRHGRDGLEKWHEDPTTLKEIYPDSSEFKIIILGGAEKVADITGKIPKAWVVYEFGAIDPQKYLSELDVFVYFPNSSLKEAFGRTIVEAMLGGVPVIIPQKFSTTFGDLPLYCEPNQVVSLVRNLAKDDQARIDYLSEVQEIAKTTFSSHSIDLRLGFNSIHDLTSITNIRMGLTSKSQIYRLHLLTFEEVTV